MNLYFNATVQCLVSIKLAKILTKSSNSLIKEGRQVNIHCITDVLVVVRRKKCTLLSLYQSIGL